MLVLYSTNQGSILSAIFLTHSQVAMVACPALHQEAEPLCFGLQSMCSVASQCSDRRWHPKLASVITCISWVLLLMGQIKVVLPFALKSARPTPEFAGFCHQSPGCQSYKPLLKVKTFESRPKHDLYPAKRKQKPNSFHNLPQAPAAA